MALMDIFKKKPAEPARPPPGPPGMPPSMPPPQPIVPGVPPTQPPMPPRSEIPINEVITLQAQGLSNNQIVQHLTRLGHQPQQIYDALAQAEAKKSIEPMNVPGESAPSRPEKHPDVEQLAEQIVEEKWQELQKDLSKMTEWKDNMTSRVDKLEQSMHDLKADLEGLHKAIVQRIGEYDKTLMDVGTEIKAMEKVFQNVLPELTGNIQELSKITEKVKGKPGTKPKSLENSMS